MKIAGKLIIAAAVVGGIAAGAVVALKTQKGKEITGKVASAAKAGAGKVADVAKTGAGKVADAAKTGACKVKEGVVKVKEKFTKKPDDVVADVTCDEICEEEVYEDELPDIAPEEIPTEEVSVDEEA